MTDKQYKPIIMPMIKNIHPMSVVDMMDSMDLEEENRKMWAKLNQVLEESNMKVAIEHRDGSVQVLDDASQILEESFKDLKGRSNE